MNTGSGNDNIIPLDDATIETLADLSSQQRACEFAKQAVLNCFGKQQKLGAGWMLAENGRELIKREQAQSSMSNLASLGGNDGGS